MHIPESFSNSIAVQTDVALGGAEVEAFVDDVDEDDEDDLLVPDLDYEVRNADEKPKIVAPIPIHPQVRRFPNTCRVVFPTSGHRFDR
jgi:hypothetical protein